MIPIAQSLAAPFPFLQLTVKVTLLLGLFFALWMMFHHKSASFRHSILVIALISIPCLFAAQWLLPSQNLPWLEQKAVANFEEAFDYAPENSVADNSFKRASDNDPVNSTLLAQKETHTVPHSEMPDGPVSTQSSQPSGVFFFSVRKVLIVIWILGSTLLLFRFAVAWLIVWRNVVSSPALTTEALEPELHRLIGDFTTSTCKFRIHRDAEQMPMCFGIFRYTILLPREFLDWDFADQKSVVLHESAHAYRRDCLVNFLAHLENAILWFHPLSWTLLRCLKSESEMACDDWAIARGVDNVNYASALFDVTMSTRRKPTVAVVSVSMSDCSPLERRMRSILSSSAPRKPISLLGQLAVATLSVIAITCLAGFHVGSTVAKQTAIKTNTRIEHRISLKDESLVRGKLTGEIEIQTTYGSATLDLEKIRSVKSTDDGRFEVRADDGSLLTGMIVQDKLPVENVDGREHIEVEELAKITTIGNAKLKPGELTSGFLKDNIAYHIRAPKGYDPAKAYPALVFFHPANSNTKTMLEDFVAQSPEDADRMLLIGLNGENKSTKVKGGFNYTYIDFAGRSKYGGFPGTDRQSPALVTEAITELKDRIPISQTYVIGKGSGAFLAFSVLMNYAEMIDGVITIDGGLLIQCVPDAYEDEELIAAQRATPLVMLYTDPKGKGDKSFTVAAKRAFEKASFPSFRYVEVKDERALPMIYKRTFKSFEN